MQANIDIKYACTPGIDSQNMLVQQTAEFDRGPPTLKGQFGLVEDATWAGWHGWRPLLHCTCGGTICGVWHLHALDTVQELSAMFYTKAVQQLHHCGAMFTSTPASFSSDSSSCTAPSAELM
eukprot:scaffold603303_cov52-Prasinocladus_malaysianus.AAC.1